MTQRDTLRGRAEQSDQIWEARQRARRQVADQFETVDDFDSIGLERAGAGIAPHRDFLDRAEPQEAAHQLDREFERQDIGPGDVERTDEGFRPTEDVFRREAAFDLDAAYGDVDIGPGDVERTDDGWGVGEDIQRQQAATDLDAQIDEIDIGTGDVVLGDDGWGVDPDIIDSYERQQEREFERARADERDDVAAQFDDEIGLIDIGPGDITEDDGRWVLTSSAERQIEAAEREEVAADFDEQLDEYDIGPDDIAEEGGQWVLADSVRDTIDAQQRQEIADQITEYTDHRIPADMISIHSDGWTVAGGMAPQIRSDLEEGQLEALAEETEPWEVIGDSRNPYSADPNMADMFVDTGPFELDDFDVVVEGDGLGLEVQEGAFQEVAIDEIASDVGVGPDALDVQFDGRQVADVQFTQDFRDEQIEQQEAQFEAQVAEQRETFRQEAADEWGIDPEYVDVIREGDQFTAELYRPDWMATEDELEDELSEAELEAITGREFDAPAAPEEPDGWLDAAQDIDTDDLPIGEVGAAAIGTAVATPEPVTTAGGLAAGGAIIGGAVLGSMAYDQLTQDAETESDLFGMSAAEVDVPASRDPVFETEVEVPQTREPTFGAEVGVPETRTPVFGAEVGVPQDVSPGFEGEIGVPETREPVFGTEVGIPQDVGVGVDPTPGIEAAPAFEQIQVPGVEQEVVEEFIDGEDIDDLSELQQAERAELARQIQQQVGWETEERYGDVVRESIIERAEREPLAEELESSPDIGWAGEQFGDVPLEDMAPFERRQLLGRMGLGGQGITTEAELQEALRRREEVEETGIFEGGQVFGDEQAFVFGDTPVEVDETGGLDRIRDVAPGDSLFVQDQLPLPGEQLFGVGPDEESLFDVGPTPIDDTGDLDMIGDAELTQPLELERQAVGEQPAFDQPLAPAMETPFVEEFATPEAVGQAQETGLPPETPTEEPPFETPHETEYLPEYVEVAEPVEYAHPTETAPGEPQRRPRPPFFMDGDFDDAGAEPERDLEAETPAFWNPIADVWPAGDSDARRQDEREWAKGTGLFW